jgi:hypothetical protein
MTKIICKSKNEMDSIKKYGDRLFHDDILNIFYIIRKEKSVWNEDDWESNFINEPELFEDCLKIKGKTHCQDCKHASKSRYCKKYNELRQQMLMEIR